jgi:hypothetical protein
MPARPDSVVQVSTLMESAISRDRDAGRILAAGLIEGETHDVNDPTR